MKSYKAAGRSGGKHWVKILIALLLLSIIAVVIAYFGVSKYYRDSLLPVNSQSTEEVNFTVNSGMTTAQIAESLSEKDLIRSSRAFVQYVRSNELSEKFIAGTYRIKQSMSSQEIAKVLTEGDVATDLFTIYPGNNISQIKTLMAEKTHYSQEDIDKAFDPALYAGHPALVDLPAGASLEGFLYPDSYQFIAETTPQDIVGQSLDEMADALTPDIRAGIAKQKLSVYQGIILASIVEREVGQRGQDGQINDNRAKAAQVFIKRLNSGMMLQSNATDGYPAEYDTYTIPGLPPEPISNVSSSALEAVANPATTNYLYFVSGKDCITRFSETNEEHEALKTAHGIAAPEDGCKG